MSGTEQTESLHNKGTDRLLDAIAKAKPMRKLLEEHKIGPSRVWLESDFQLMSNNRLLKRYWVYFEDTHVVRRVEWVGQDDIDAAHRAYVVAIQACQDRHAAEIVARKLAARAKGLNLKGDLLGKMGEHFRRSRVGFHWGHGKGKATRL